MDAAPAEFMDEESCAMLKKLPESSRNTASMPYGISFGSLMNSTPRALSSW